MRNWKDHLAGMVVLLVLALVVAGLTALVVNADDPAPATVVGVKNVTLRDGLHYIGDAATRSEDTTYFAIADVFYTWEIITETDTINPYLEFSPDGVAWSRTLLPSIKGPPSTVQLTRTAIYGTRLRVGFDMVTDTIDYTPTVKVTLKNLGD